MTQRTYWHLEALQRKPTEYEVVTTNLLYYPSRGFEVETPVTAWYRKYQSGSPLVLPEPDRFADPRETTYPKYTSIQRDRETYVDGLLESIDATDYDRKLSPAWIKTLSRILSPLRFPVHGLQMTAAYVGQMAPGGRIAIAALFQCADEMRRIQRLAYRQRQLQAVEPGFGDDGRKIWQEDPAWQPMRELVEKLLVAYDWGESFAALNLVVKPMFDELFMVQFGALAERSGDPMLGRIFLSLYEDDRWHREWSVALARLLVRSRAENAEVLRGWIRRWHPPALRAVKAFAPLMESLDLDKINASCAEVCSAAELPGALE